MSTSRIAGALFLLCGLSACANFAENPPRARLSDDFSYYEPFDNAGETGPNYLMGPPPSRSAVVRSLPDATAAISLPSIPDRSLPRSCLSCN
jgi:hypothetical protein